MRAARLLSGVVLAASVIGLTPHVASAAWNATSATGPAAAKAQSIATPTMAAITCTSSGNGSNLVLTLTISWSGQSSYTTQTLFKSVNNGSTSSLGAKAGSSTTDSISGASKNDRFTYYIESKAGSWTRDATAVTYKVASSNGC